MNTLPLFAQDDKSSEKKCKECKAWKPANTNYFSPTNKNGDLYSTCKVCRNTEWKLKHPHARSRGQKTSQLDVPEGYRRCTKCKNVLVATLDDFDAHPTQKSGLHPRCKACRAEDTEVYRKTLDKDETAQYNKEYRVTHHEELNASRSKYAKENVEYIRQWQKNYRRNHLEQIRVYGRNKRARKRNAPGTHTKQDVQSQYERQRKQCYYCCVKLTKYHVDHVVPLSRGGSNGPDNLVVTCPTCNLRKNNKLPHEFFQGGRLL